MTAKPETTKLTPEAQLRSFLGKLDPQVQKLVRSVRTAARRRLPTANELVYDYSHSLVIGYSPTDHGIDAIVAISARADVVSLHFNQGPRLPDPKKLLQGSGKQTRFIRLDTARQFSHPDVEAMIAAAIDQAKIPLPSQGKGKVLIRGAAAKSSPRRKAKK